MVLNSCCCFDLRTGTIFILILNIVQYTVPRPALQFLSDFCIIFRHTTDGKIVEYEFNDWALLAMIVGYFIYGMALYGAFYRKPSYMMLYLVLLTIYIIFYTIVTALLIFNVVQYRPENPNELAGLGIFILYFMINMYSFLVVYSYHGHLRKVESGEYRRLVDRYGATA